ncbi:MAG TPA: tRNA (adenosine(37)-N6)-threonylcarbamoyltransferase complex ATPase subunit type 1 TsaE [Pirellulaceae bacterium]|jgi:tRNA threonylcarbamoyladenosine biosynthesis protein TsaE|nr:tRNA (adenosine(37)-N6)-threonylcarbamoyltransferase complex ATPase subunit type 1 TsaE [Pirellulaceae bacterium]
MSAPNTDTLSLALPDLAATDALGQALAEAVEPGTTICLTGSLGAGKTRLMQALGVALGIPREEIVSPTFVLCRQHAGRSPREGVPLDLWHLDAYRVEDEDAFLELGIEEMCAGDDVVCVEWGERFGELLPKDRLNLTISVTGESSRRADASAGGSVSRRVLQRLRQALA